MPIRPEPWEPLAEKVRELVKGPDQDVALAMANQARLGMNPIDTIQVIHLLSIGVREGYAAGFREGYETAATGHDKHPSDQASGGFRPYVNEGGAVDA